MAVQTVLGSTLAKDIVTPLFVSVAQGPSNVAQTCPVPTVAWTARTLPATANWQSIAYGNDIFFAISSPNNYAGASMDGITWGLREMPFDASWGTVVYSDKISKFICTIDGSTTVAMTPLGFMWETHNFERDGKYTQACVGKDGLIVVLGTDSDNAQVSYDGSTWQYRQLPSVQTWKSVCFDACLNRYVAIASGTNQGAYSNDGSTWTAMTMNLNSTWNCVASNNRGRYVAVNTATSLYSSYSDDGINWIQGFSMQNSRSWRQVAYLEPYHPDFGARWVAISNGTRNAYSTDGITWVSLTVTAREVTSVCPAYITWRSADTLTINNAATVTVETDQTKFWTSISIVDGLLRIKNDSSTNAIRFLMGRSVNPGTVVAATITPATGNGNIEVLGNFIDLSVGTGLANQEITLPYKDYVSALWVETGYDTSIFEIWLNVTGGYGGTPKKFIEGLDCVVSGRRGMFFIQKPNPIQNTIIKSTFLNASTGYGANYVHLPTTEGIDLGAQIMSAGNIAIPLNSVIERIIDGSVLQINQMCTNTSNPVDVSIYNPLYSQLTNVAVFGDGVNGNVIPNGARVLIPNIMLTAALPCRLATASLAVSGLSFVMTNGGNITLKNCLMDEVYNVYTQAQSLTIENVGTWNSDTLSECYDVNIDGYAQALGPARRIYGTTGWILRDLGRDNLASIFLTGSYINNANFNNIVAAKNIWGTTAGSITVPAGPLNISYSTGVTGTNLRFYELQNYIAGHTALAFTAPISNSNFSNIESYVLHPAFIVNSLDNTFSNMTFSHSMFNTTLGYAIGQRIGYNSENNEELVDNTPYYLKVRSFFTRDRSTYADSQEFSFTPFLGDKLFPDYLTCYCNASKSVLLAWALRYPTHNNPSYEIYRGTTPDFVRDTSSLIFRTNTQATVTWTNTATNPTLTAAAGRTLTWDPSGYIRASTGSFVTDGYFAGDKLIVTGTTYNNGNDFKIEDVSTLYLKLTVPRIVEGPLAATAKLECFSANMKYPITASASRTFTFNINKTITANSGSFIIDGYVVGDVVEITGCTDPTNNGTKTISVLTATVMTVLETLVTEVAYTSSATITGKPLLGKTTYYYVFRKYHGAGVDSPGIGTYSDSAPQEVYVHDVNDILINRILQSDTFDNASWTKTNCAVTANVTVSPTLAPSSTTANADLVIASAANGTISQRFLTAQDTSYNFSVFYASMPLEDNVTTECKLQLGDASIDFVADSSWNRVNVTYKTPITLKDASSTLAQIIIKNDKGRLLLSEALANTGSVPENPATTTTVPLTITAQTRYPTLIRNWCRSYGGETKNSGVEITYYGTGTGSGVAPIGVVWTEIYCSSTKGFTPNTVNRIANISNTGYNPAIIGLYNGSSRNVFDGVTQIEKAFATTYGVYMNIFCSNNTFKNFNNIYANYCVMTNLIYPAAGSNDNLIHNWDVNAYRNYASVAPIYAANTASGLTVQNVRLNHSDIPVSSQILNTTLKGITGGNATPATNAIITNLGSAVDGMAIAYTAVYDSIFNELYFDGSKGALHVAFNASLKDPKPYTLLGEAQYSNTGKLYLQNPSDGIEIEWPHTILGVSGFRTIPKVLLQNGLEIEGEIPYKLSGLDLGTTNDLLEGLVINYDIDKGAGYTGYRRCISSNLLIESVSSSDGFKMKFKIEAVKNMKYGTKTTAFVPGELIQGETTLSTAIVNKVYEVSVGSLLGTIWVSDVSGTFNITEYIRSVDSSIRRARNVATNTLFAFGPSFTSYIDGFQLYTYTDTSVLYPSETITLTMTVKDESNNPIIGAYAFIDDAAVSSPYIMNTTTNSLGIATVAYSGGASAGSTWRVRKYGYKPYVQTVDIASADISLPVTLIVDPQQT